MKSLNLILDHARQHPQIPVALATLVRTHGSTYRKPGARMLVTPEGHTIGVLSGGCLEELIARDGLDVLEHGQARLRVLDTRQYFGCDGRLEIFVERIEAAGGTGNVLTQLAEQCRQRHPSCLCTRFRGRQPGSSLAPAFSLLENPEDVFIQHVPLPVRILAFGHGPEMEPLSAMTQMLGWELRVFDHPARCGEEYRADASTAALVMNHHFGKDAETLLRILAMDLPYIGILGPRRRTNQLLSRLLDAGAADPASFACIHAPAGLDIGSESPEEIVLSITSEILAVLSDHQAGFLSQRSSPRPAAQEDAPRKEA